MDVGPRIVQAGVAVAAFLQRAEVALVLGAGEVVPAGGVVERRVAGHPGGGDAVEGVRAVLNGGEDVVRFGDAQQVPRLVLRQLLVAPAHDRAEVLLLQRPADPEAVEVHGAEVAAGLAAQVLVLGALDHPEQGLVGLAGALVREPEVLGDAPLGPAPGPLQGLLLVAAGVLQRGELVEREHDVRADLVLDVHGDLGAEAVPVAVEVALEPHAFLVHMGQAFLAGGDGVVRPRMVHRFHVDDLLEPRAQAHHLEPAGIGERGTAPVHERAQAAGLVQDVRARLQVQVVGVGQHGLRAEFGNGFRQHGLDRGLGADGDERRGLDLAVRGGDGAGPAQELTAVGGNLPGRRRARSRSGVCPRGRRTRTAGQARGTKTRSQDWLARFKCAS